jgi:gluconolactonase
MESIARPYEYYDRRFYGLTNSSAHLEELFTGLRWAEGPVWFNDGGYLLCSDIPNNRIMRWVPDQGTGVFRANSNYANGHTRDRQGRLVSCEHGTRRVTRTEPDGSITVIADSHAGKRLNSPNDVVVTSDDCIWFTDPPYGILSDYEGHKAPQEQKGCYVYRVDPRDGSIKVVADDFMRPNGLAFSPDEKTLYIADSARSLGPEAPHHVRAFSVDAKGKLSKGRVLCDIDPGVPDGLRLDVQGNLWISCGDGIVCVDAEGAPLGKIKVPQEVANLTFGGPKRNLIFIAATTSVYSIMVTTNGVQVP